ncbi:hypothetical protein ACFVH6_21975 [Spirillospora sp. NPDC127200]
MSNYANGGIIGGGILPITPLGPCPNDGLPLVQVGAIGPFKGGVEHVIPGPELRQAMRRRTEEEITAGILNVARTNREGGA